MVPLPTFTSVVTLLLLNVKCPDVVDAFQDFKGYDVPGQTLTNTSGKGGEECPPSKYKCGEGASCVDGRCVCDEDTHGHETFFCASANTYVTMVLADPLLVTYHGSRAHITLPCRVLLTEILSQHSMGKKGGECRILVNVLTHQVDRGYYVLGYDLEVTITDNARTNAIGQTSIRIYGYGSGGQFWYKEHGRSMGQQAARFGHWARPKRVKYMDQMINSYFDPDHNYAVVDLPHCGVKTVFRAHVKYTRQMPGLLVAVNKDIPVSFPQTNNPLSGSPFQTDHRDIISLKHELHLTKAETILYMALTQNTQQDFGLPGISCNVAIREYSHFCQGAEQRAFALYYCSFFYIDATVSACLNADEFGETSGSLFGVCSYAMCHADSFMCNTIVNDLLTYQCGVPQRLQELDCYDIHGAFQRMFPEPWSPTLM